MELGRSELSVNRIRKELSKLWIDPPAFCRLGASPVTDPYHFEVIIDGPAGSPYAGGTFPVDVVIPKDYPFKPPKLTFKTKVYHPNIDSEGKMYLDIFKKSNWSPALTISKLLVCIVSVLCVPLLDLPVRHDIALQYSHERALFERTASNWTRKYATAGKEGESKTKGLRARRAGLLAAALAPFRSRPIWSSKHARARVHVASSLAC